MENEKLSFAIEDLRRGENMHVSEAAEQIITDIVNACHFAATTIYARISMYYEYVGLEWAEYVPISHIAQSKDVTIDMMLIINDRLSKIYNTAFMRLVKSDDENAPFMILKFAPLFK